MAVGGRRKPRYVSDVSIDLPVIFYFRNMYGDEACQLLSLLVTEQKIVAVDTDSF